MLTKEQDKIATRLRDAGVPGDIAVLLASRKSKMGFLSTGFVRYAVLDIVEWKHQPEKSAWWSTFESAFRNECYARGIE